MARLWQCGFELNSLTTGVEISATSGTISLQTTTVRTGTYALRTNAGTSFVRQHLAGSNQSTQVWTRVYLQVTTMPAATTAVVRFANGSNATCAQIGLTNAGTLVLNDATGAAVGSASSALSTGVWYMIELALDASTSPGTVTGRLDGTQFATGANSSQASWARALIGIIGSTTGDLQWDDWAVNDSTGSAQTSWPGSGKILHLIPNGDGDNHAWANTANGAGASTNSTLVDEIPPNDSTDFVQSGTLNAEDMYALTDSGIASSDVVNVVMVGARMRNNTADATTAAKLQIKKTSGGTITQGSAIIPNTTTFFTNANAEPRNYTLVTYLDPDGAAWTQGTLDTAQAGAKVTASNVNRVQISALWVSVDYTPSSSTPISNSDTGAGADAGSVSAAVPGTETGTASDSGSVSATTSSAETGAGSDATSLAATLTQADTGTGADVGTVSVTIAQADTASGVEATSVAAATSDSDTASGAEAASLIVFSADTASGADAAIPSVTQPDSDTSSGTDTANVTASQPGSDTGSGVDTGSIGASLASADIGAGADAQTVSVSLASADTGTSVDAALIGISQAEAASGLDAGSTTAATSSNDLAGGVDNASVVTFAAEVAGGTDSAFVAAAFTTAETATSTDSASVSAGVTQADTAAGVDVVSVSATIAAPEAASGTDSQSVAQDVVPVSATDTASGVDAGAVTASVPASETGSSLDGTTDRTLSTAELGAGSDLGSIDAALTSTDTASAVQTEVLAVTINASEIGSGTDVVSDLSAAISAVDTATGLDVGVVPGNDAQDVFSGDTATGTEAQTLLLGAAQDDSAEVTEAASVFVAILVSDAMAGAEGAPRIEVTASDTAVAVESASPFAQAFAIETSSALDSNQAIQAAISTPDDAAGIEAILTLDASVSSGDVGAAAEASPTGNVLSSGDTVSSSDLSVVSASLASADAAASFAQTGTIAGYVSSADTAIGVDGNFLFIDNFFDSNVIEEAFAEDFADVFLNVTDQASALDFAKIGLSVSDGAFAADFAGVILGVFASDGSSIAEASAVGVVRVSDEPIVGHDNALVSAGVPTSEIIHAKDSASVFITPTRSHRVMPYYIREPQNWAIEQERRRHNEALWYVGENTMFVLMWHLEDFLDNLVGRCPTCYESQGRIANVYGQSDEYKCLDCFGTTFEGGFKALIVRPAIFSDSDEGETRDRRGVVHPQDLTIESTPDFRVRTGDYCFRVTGDRYYMRVPERITLRTGFGHATQTETAIGYNHANAAVEDPDSVAYLIPPANDEVSQILNRSSRVPRDWSTFEVIRAPLIPSSDLIGGS